MKIEIDELAAADLVGNVLVQDYKLLLEHDFGVDNREELIKAYKVVIAYYTTAQ